MRILRIKVGDLERTAIRLPQGLLTVRALGEAAGRSWPEELPALLETGALADIGAWLSTERGTRAAASLPPLEPVGYESALLIRRPRKVWGIGFNYLSEEQEQDREKWESEEPVGFMKPDTSLIGPNDPIVLPAGVGRVQAEAELAIVIGAVCRDVSEAEAYRCVAGFAAAIDVTAADVHARNPRFLTRAKSYDTFCSLGAELITPDELGDIGRLTVTTALNGEARHSLPVSSMIYRPWRAVAYHSRFMTLLPGDIILTGTPGAVPIADGDRIECRIDGFAPLANPVRERE
ncbi:2-keto-4-pentenoate hydratase/2-oxohepta-3-ene-1,7-dioic acid hydratase (catechol pathway) [Cohnella sp. OV330]|uniref:fumarylacetoacetate hydrolase family protein n=1 Tax=Cohnella sp. OV330 TaxID=1855288 RepID=UPI0008E00135|nr:fumarylacetoacetate hydrolase family protein [Cohnella sp. OV330]SFA82698.1 2-keto-4-pentenoate hydratase/2-oxohepta-3-ene-1,7-dioic acid hydratase (catechol pathway) [Cohnella sp. OV330]